MFELTIEAKNTDVQNYILLKLCTRLGIVNSKSIAMEIQIQHFAIPI